MAYPKIRDEINKVFANIGKALAAYQRTLLPMETALTAFLMPGLPEGKSPMKMR